MFITFWFVFSAVLLGVVRAPDDDYPMYVNEGGRDIHYFTTSGWRGLKEPVVVPFGYPLALTCDFRNKVSRALRADGVPRSSLLTKTLSVNITFPFASGQKANWVNPAVNKFEGSWESFTPDVTVFFPRVVSNTVAQCKATYLENGENHTSIIMIPITTYRDAPLWYRSVNISAVKQVSCTQYDHLSERLPKYSHELYQVVSLVLSGDTLVTTVPRAALLLPYTGAALSQAGTSNETHERLHASPDQVTNNFTCVVYHVHRPEWGVYVTRYEVPVSSRFTLSWFAIFVICVCLLTVVSLLVYFIITQGFSPHASITDTVDIASSTSSTSHKKVAI